MKNRKESVSVPCPLTPDELRTLANSEAFQELVAADPELDRLESLQYRKTDEISALQETLFRPCGRIGKLSVMPLTPARWALLWSFSSPYVRGGSVRTADIELFLYLLTLDLRPGSPFLPDLPRRALGICRRAALPSDEIHKSLLERIRIAFLPLKLLPPPGAGSDASPARFDAEWLNRICSAAAVRTGTPIGDVMFFMSLNQVCWQYVNMLRDRPGSRGIRRRPDSEIARRMLLRVYELGEDFLRKA